MKDKKFLALSSIFFLLFFVGMTVVTINGPASTILRASTATVSPVRSFAMPYPNTGVAGSTKIKFSVYLLDVNGVIFKNRSVKVVAPNSDITISPSDTQNTNDTAGMAQFFISSKSPGIFKMTVLDASTNTPIQNVPSIEFTK